MSLTTNALLKWVATVTASLLVTMHGADMIKTVNEESAERHASQQAESAVEPTQPYLMGSAKVSAALQNILSSDVNAAERSVYIRAMHNKSKQNYELGSEALNRTLEEIMMPKEEEKESRTFEPAVKI
ncbi:uncharacterized protein LOC115631863 [Scaptodrosophila lebanonensis]|uniref:Uncharacterized protein LOC115631863 n=1 Tax=Drosophila lebanonensis TaxID=7225 RepID=A0A6J2UBJ4_DROLE|nr:uncharacterized protein LOC115631863 [Scaptodrosophila lebanonensis]